jgi:pimeloyl-ACP methyl ester carboxylesterase
MAKEGYYTINDEKIYIQTYGDASHQPIVFVHGILSYPDRFINIINLLKDKYYIIAPHLLGTGKSGGIRGTIDMDFNIQIILQTIKLFNLNNIILMAQSMGSPTVNTVNNILTKEVMITVKRLVFVSPYIFADSHSINEMGFDFTRLPSLPLYIINKLVYYLLPKFIVVDSVVDFSKLSKKNENMINALNDGLISKTCPLYANFSLFQHVKDFRKINTSVPLTIILGSGDEVRDVRKSLDFFSSLPAIKKGIQRTITSSQWKDAFSTLVDNNKSTTSEFIVINGGSHEFFLDD